MEQFAPGHIVHYIASSLLLSCLSSIHLFRVNMQIQNVMTMLSVGHMLPQFIYLFYIYSFASSYHHLCSMQLSGYYYV